MADYGCGWIDGIHVLFFLRLFSKLVNVACSVGHLGTVVACVE